MKRLAKWTGHLNTEKCVIIAGVFAVAIMATLAGFDRWLVKRGALRIVEGLERHALTNGVAVFDNSFEHVTNRTEWFDHATEVLSRTCGEITDEQALEQLLGFKPKSNVNCIKAWLHLREAAEHAGVGDAVDKATGTMLEELVKLVEKQAERELGRFNPRNPFDPMIDFNKKGSM